MDACFLVLRILLCTLNTFMTMSVTLLMLYCFYDTGFRWSGKKCIIFTVVSILDAIILACFDNKHIYGDVICYLVLPMAAIYDYQGKKSAAFIRYILLFYLISHWSNGIARFGYCLISQGDHTSFLAPFDWLHYDYIPTVMSMSEQELLEYFASIDIPSQGTLSNSMILFNYSLNIIFFGFVFCYLYYRLYKQGIVFQFGKRGVIFAISYYILCEFIFGSFAYFGLRSIVTSTILSVLSILLALLFPLFVCNARISEYHRKRTAIQQQHLEAELAHFLQYKQTQEETRRFRHDIRNNLLCMSQMLQQGKVEETAEYLNDLLQTSDTLRAKYVTGDEMLDCIVGVKSGIMEQKQIQFQLDGVLAGGLKWKPVDICNVFANALDNAVEACEQLPHEDRWISMSIKSTPQFWFISIENPVKESVDTGRLFQRQSGYTSKTDSDCHGIGTYNMRHTVETYGGMVKADCSMQTFSLEIILDKNNAI